MPEANVIKAHMEVLGSDGGHVGTVDAIEGDRIKLTRNDSGDGQHHYVSTGLVQDIRGNSVTLTKPAADALGAGQDGVDSRDLPEDPQAGIASQIG